MRWNSWGAAAVLCVSVVVLAGGCGGKPDKAGKDGKKKDAEPELILKSYEAEQLLPLLDTSLKITLDGKRVETAAPTGWKTTPALTDDLASLYFTEPLRMPNLTIEAKPFDHDTIKDVNMKNLAEFLSVVSDRAKKQKLKFIEGDEPLAMLLGGRPCVRYVISQREGFQDARKQVLQTVVGGRLYVVTLIVDTLDMLKAHNRNAYAVLAGMKFGGEGGGESKPDAKAVAKPETKTEAKPETK